MKEHRLKRPALVMELSLAIAASLVVGMFAWYAVPDLALLLRLKWGLLPGSVRLWK
jgi:hypothetical protein